MSIKIKRQNGEVTLYRNAEYIQLFYFLPKSLLDKCGKLPFQISRYPYELFTDWKQIELIESDQFALLMYDAFHYLVWPYMGLNVEREVYSGNHPAWKLSHAPSFWIKTMQDESVLPSIESLVKDIQPITLMNFLSDEYVDTVLLDIVPKTMERFGMNDIIAVTKAYRCFEDFDDRPSQQKTDFKNSYYHRKTKHPMISLESFQEKYKKDHDGSEWDVIDESFDLEGDTAAKVDVESFMSTLSEKDRKILELRVEGYTYQEIADKVGYKTHSATGRNDNEYYTITLRRRARIQGQRRYLHCFGSVQAYRTERGQHLFSDLCKKNPHK